MRAGRFAGEPETEFPDQSPFRGHYARMYAPAGTRYEEVAAAYEYGAQAVDQFAGRGWDEAIPELRSLWERENPASWDRYREAVRHGWESRGGS